MKENSPRRGAAKSVLVTGASSGIGRAVMEAVAKEGSLVYATARTRKGFASLRKLPNVHPLKMDVTKPEQVRRGIDEIRRAGKGLDGLVNNAAIIDVWPLAELEEEELKRSLDVNVLGVHGVVREAIPLLAGSRGRIVNISSLEGLVTTKFAGPYETSKFALEAYSDNLRRELEGHGVKVVLVEPGGFRSNYAKTTAGLLERRRKARSPSLMKREVQEIVRGWRDEVEDVDTRASPSLVAAAVLEALSSARPKNRYVVTAHEGEFRWAMEELVSRLNEVNRGSGYALSKEDIHALVDAKWAG